MPEHLGPDTDEDGLIDYAGSEAEFRKEEEQRQGFDVELAVRRDLCRKDALYTWRSSAGTTTGRGGAGCRMSQRFAEEGPQPVRLSIRFPGGKTTTFDRRVTVQDWLVVSIGDSVASGEGVPDRRGRNLLGDRSRARWHSPRCHRSAKAAPAKAALALEAADPRTSTTFVHLACSGASIEEGLLGGYTGIDTDQSTQPLRLPPQIEELEQIARERDVDAVLLSIGANDVYFGPIVAFCLKKRGCTKVRFQPELEPGAPPVAGGELAAVVGEALKRLPAAYAELARRLRTVVPSKQVLAVEYFDPIHDSDGSPCRIGLANPLLRLGQIDRDEAGWASSALLEPLNATLKTASEAAEWTYVGGVADAFRTHGYCADDSWVVHILESLRKQKGLSWKSRLKGGFHPNETGHREEAAVIGLVLAGTLYGGPLREAADDTVLITNRRPGDPEPDGEGDLERTGGVVLAALLLALAGAIWLIARRERNDRDRWAEPEEWNEPPPLPPLPERLPPQQSWQGFATLLENQADWVHRRVQSIELVDERLVRWQVSVDFTPAAARQELKATHVPIALLGKRVLTRFDLRDEEGASLPLATSEENAAFALGYMLSLAKHATQREPSPRLRQLCWQIARGVPKQAHEAIEEIARDLEPEISESLRKSESFRQATVTFADNFAVIVEVDDPRRRRVIKLAYDQTVRGKLTWRHRLGLDPVLTKIALPELGDAESNHVEFVRVQGLELWGAHLYGEEPGGEVVFRTGSLATSEAHLNVTRMPRGTRGLAGVYLRAARSGILVGGPPLSLLSALTLTAAWFALPQLAGTSATGAASILLAVPAAFGAYLGSRRPHPFESALLRGARGLVFASGALAFIAAAALALSLSTPLLRIVLGAVALLSWLTAAGLTVSFLSPRLTENDRKAL